MSRQSGPTAQTVLQRLLLTLPLAVREEGVRIESLADELGVEPRQILRDLAEVEGRSYYLPSGLGDQIQITLTRDQLKVWTTGEFQRPVRLSPKEALALELGLRVVARSASVDERSRMEELRERLVSLLRTPRTGHAENPAISLGPLEAEKDTIRTQVETALRELRELRFVYRSPGRTPTSRRVGPLVLAHAEGRWYLLARDLEREALRAFRLDRMLEAEVTSISFESSSEDEAAVERYFQDGRVHDGGGRGSEPFEAVVEYSSRIARWMREHAWEGMEDRSDGGLRIRHRVVDPEWLLRHVLGYGADARIVEPGWMQQRVIEVVRRFETTKEEPGND